MVTALWFIHKSSYWLLWHCTFYIFTNYDIIIWDSSWQHSQVCGMIIMHYQTEYMNAKNLFRSGKFQVRSVKIKIYECSSIRYVYIWFLYSLYYIVSLWCIFCINDKDHKLSISYKFRQNQPLNTWVIALVLV